MLSKGDFKGFLFVKCLNVGHREQLIRCIARAPGDAWADQDRPIDVRTAAGTLFGVKRMLTQWGYNKSCINVNEDAGSLSVAGTGVLKVTVQDFVLIMSWCDGQWANGKLGKTCNHHLNLKF